MCLLIGGGNFFFFCVFCIVLGTQNIFFRDGVIIYKLTFVHEIYLIVLYLYVELVFI